MRRTLALVATDRNSRGAEDRTRGAEAREASGAGRIDRDADDLDESGSASGCRRQGDGGMS